jgi:MerR family copper efflux transcriptional regulator
MVLAKPMTIGQLARRTGMPIKALREYEQLGLLYTLGRSESNYRLFDEEALWCVQLIRTMRSLGLTLKEIQELTTLYLERPGEPIGPRLSEKLEAALGRIEARIADLQALRQRIRDFQSAHAAELAGEAELDILTSDPRRTLSKSRS